MTGRLFCVVVSSLSLLAACTPRQPSAHGSRNFDRQLALEESDYWGPDVSRDGPAPR